MAQKSWPWSNNATGDGTSGGYTALEWSTIWRDLYTAGGETTQGVIRGVMGELAVSGTASPITVASGSAVVFGKFFRSTSSENLTVETPSIGTTAGVVVLELDWTAQTVRLQAVRANDGVSTEPTLTQNESSDVYQVKLAGFTINTSGTITVTDARQYAYFGTMVKTAMLDNNAVTAAKIATSVAGNGLAGGGGSALSVNVDGTTLEISSDALRIKNDGVDDTKVGNRVPAFTRRQGGSSSSWIQPGTTNYTPTNVRMQGGSVSVAGGATLTTVTFPIAFSNIPIVFLQGYTSNGVYIVSVAADEVVFGREGNAGGAVTAFWLALGDE